MTDLQSRPPRVTGVRHSLMGYAIPTAVLVLAMFGSMTQAPWPVRIVAAGVLMILPGAALTRLLFGEREDQAIRLPLTVLFGLMLWLATALILNLIGTSINATSLAIGVGVVGLPATVASQWRRSHNVHTYTADVGTTATLPGEPRRRMKDVGAVICSVAAIALALVVAEAIQPHHVERYASLGFIDTPQFVDGRIADAAPGGQVRLNWVLRGYGYDLSTTSASVSVTVDGSPVDNVAIDVGPSTEPDEPGATSTVDGAVTFAAPMNRGGHVVAVTVVPATTDGTAVPAPGFISTVLEVK
ncbi:hypothetical protein [Mycobacterium neglectum]|uniref:hypothetical protein n=1 Tax=Mycobacterium neglectum TaxID=242737 RepID=UPI0011458A9E|nr:hypothetical protein [Mycobacterium neglectum]